MEDFYSQNPNDKQDDSDSLLSKKTVYKFDLRTLLLPIMQKNRRTTLFSSFLLLFHFLTLFSLRLESSDFPSQIGLMPSIHFVVSKFNMIYLLGNASLQYIIMNCFLGFNVCYLLSMIILGFLGDVHRKNVLRGSLTRFHVYIFQIYNWIVLIPSTHLSSFLLMQGKSCNVVCQVSSASNILLAILITNFIEYSRININFKCEDSLDSRVDMLDKLVLNYKFLVILMAGAQFFVDYWLILLYFVMLVDYFRKIPFYVEKISLLYFSCLMCFFFAHLIYFALFSGFFSLKYVDISYVLFFGCSVLIKTSIQLRGFLIIHKLKSIAKFGLRNKLDFDLYIRETYANLKNFRVNLDAKVLFLSFFSIHQNSCVLPDCACKLVKNDSEASFLRNKKTFKRVVETYFLEYLMFIRKEEYEDVFLMYCSFVSSVLKLPSKALNALLVNKDRIKSLKNRILIEILLKKSKKALEKKLLNNDQYAQSFSTVILFDHQVRLLELTLRKLIVSEISINQLLINENDVQNTAFDKFFALGRDVNGKIEQSKELIKKLFDKNVNNVRLIQLTILIIKYLSEDLTFRNFYKQLNIKRINQQILKRKKGQDSIDIFENDVGVVFLSLSKKVGFIKKFSKNIPGIFGCDSAEMKDRNIKEYMPVMFTRAHDEILLNFIKSGKAVLLTSNLVQLYGVTKQNFLMHLNLIIRLDTFFAKDFMIGGYVKSLKNSMSKTILLDIHGNFVNCSKEVANFLDFTRLSFEEQTKISMVLLIPDIMDKLLPFNYQEIFLKRNTDFKMKGFLFTPIAINEKTLATISIKDRIYSSFQEFSKLEDSDKKFQELRVEVFRRLSTFVPQDFRFFRVHFTLIVQNFSNNCVNVRLIEVYDIFEIKDMKLQIQYLNKKTKNLKEMLKNELNHSPATQRSLELIDKFPEKNDKYLTEKSEKKPKTVEKSEDFSIDKDIRNESFLSVSNITEIEPKIKTLNEISSSKPVEKGSNFLETRFLTVKEQFSKAVNSEVRDSLTNNTLVDEELLSKSNSSEHNVDFPSKKRAEENLKPSLSTIEQEESEMSLIDHEEQDFEERISLISNNEMNKKSTEEETLMDENTQTHGGSQVSRVSSHASGDGKKSTIDVLNKVSVNKIYVLKLLNTFLWTFFFVLTVTFFVLSRNEGLNLETTLKNSGIFHNQLSPLCILTRDSVVIKFLYSSILEDLMQKKTELVDEIKSSIEFNNILLLRAYKNGIAQADSSVDFVYEKFVNVTIENVTLYTFLLENSTDPLIKHYVPIKILPSNLINMWLNIPQSILFFLSAAEHFYYSEILDDIKNASDAQNYILFLQENILQFIQSMLEILEINKEKISGSVAYLNNLNMIFFILVIFASIYGVVHTSYISVKTKFKANKFCALFFNFQENELEERSNKLRHVLDRYFDRNAASYTATENTSLKLTTTEVSSKPKQDLFSTDKINMFRTDLLSSKKTKSRNHRAFKRSNSIKQIKGKKFQHFLFFFVFIGFFTSMLIIGVFLSNYVATDSFSANVIEITEDLESVETYVITLHIQYAANSILLGLFDENSERKQEKMLFADELLDIVDQMQSQITDLTTLFKVSQTDHILTQLKYEFFTKDICELINFIKENIKEQDDNVKEIANRLKGMDFCQQLLKNVLTKGSTSFAFEINEIFKQWQDYIRYGDFAKNDLVSIVKTQEFLDINYALPYVYALGLYDITLMMQTAENYFQQVRDERIMWFVWALIVIFAIFSVPYQKLIKHLNRYSENAFSLIKIFPYTMINNNKMLENKISRITKMQKI